MVVEESLLSLQFLFSFQDSNEGGHTVQFGGGGGVVFLVCKEFAFQYPTSRTQTVLDYRMPDPLSKQFMYFLFNQSSPDVMQCMNEIKKALLPKKQGR